MDTFPSSLISLPSLSLVKEYFMWWGRKQKNFLPQPESIIFTISSCHLFFSFLFDVLTIPTELLGTPISFGLTRTLWFRRRFQPHSYLGLKSNPVFRLYALPIMYYPSNGTKLPRRLKIGFLSSFPIPFVCISIDVLRLCTPKSLVEGFSRVVPVCKT